MKHTVSVFLLLIFFWLINSGYYKPLLLSFGLFSAIFVVYLTHRMDVVDHESHPLHLFTLKLPSYYLWLVGQLIISNIDVVKRVWSGRNSISPCAAWLPLSQTTDIGRVIYANSITLTPGTVAMDLEDDRVYVHALSREGLEDLRAGEMDRRVSNLER